VVTKAGRPAATVRRPTTAGFPAEKSTTTIGPGRGKIHEKETAGHEEAPRPAGQEEQRERGIVDGDSCEQKKSKGHRERKETLSGMQRENERKVRRSVSMGGGHYRVEGLVRRREGEGGGAQTHKSRTPKGSTAPELKSNVVVRGKNRKEKRGEKLLAREKNEKPNREIVQGDEWGRSRGANKAGKDCGFINKHFLSRLERRADKRKRKWSEK